MSTTALNKHNNKQPIQINNKHDRYIVVNGEYLMANGVFENNPFHKQYKLTRIVGYLMGNPEKSKALIKRLMRNTGYQRYTNQVVDDIYGYAMDFHSVKQDKDFRPNYFNDSGYRIEQYLEKALRQAVNSYNRRELLNKKTKELNIDDDSEEPKQSTVRSHAFQAVELETSRAELEYFYECFDYLGVIVENTKPRNKKVTAELVYDIFLSGFDRVSVRKLISQKEGYYELDEGYYEHIYDTYKMTERQVTAWMNRIKKSEDMEPFSEMTKELVLPISEGNFMREDIVGFSFD